MGNTPLKEVSPPPPRTLCIFEEPPLEEAFRSFLEIEEVAASEGTVTDECEEKFRLTTMRNQEGRYIVQLPFSSYPPDLGESFSFARQRLLSLEKHLQRSPDLRQQYHRGMQDYLDQGHVSFATDQDPHSGFFIPHFAVVKESSSTPVRIVFDASCKSSNGRSLNDNLLSGPKLQGDIRYILLRFRIHPAAVIADIRQMFRNILVEPAQRYLQRLLWRFGPQEEIQILQLNCVPFGLRCAPFLALRTVQQLAEDENTRFPIAARIAKCDMYVDDVVSSVPDEETSEVVPQLVGLFKAGGFSLAKWTTNSAKIAETLPKEERQNHLIPLDKDEAPMNSVKVLGLNWDARNDVFSFAYRPREGRGTKREILSTLARIWDPLGFLTPVTLLCKDLVKKLWQSKCGWDDCPPEEISKVWARVLMELPQLTGICIPRYPGRTQDPSTLVVGFADSSEVGFGGVVYLITRETRHDQPKVTLLIAKAKIAPLKLHSIPRLELCAAMLLSKLFQLLFKAFPHVQPAQVYALSDSEDVLHWLAKPAYTWKTFVANRVEKIQEVLPADRWYHVPGKENIADLISRGATPRQLLNHPWWKQGPPWLSLPMPEWPVRRIPAGSRLPLEAKSFTAVVTEPGVPQPVQELIQRSSSWSKLLRITAYLLRFGKRLPSQHSISARELEQAELRLIRITQLDHFAEDFACLAQKKPTSSTLRPLQPFLHEGCIRVGGRLEQAQIPFEAKHPLLLPKHCHLVDLIVDYYHRLYLHAGPSLLLSLLRQRFWILSARNTVRKHIHLCQRCFRLNPKASAPPMGSLPAPRVTQAKPFVHCGVDYAGPFSILMHRHRGAKSRKGYICLFICFSTKALHLELASDLSTEAFLQCFTRFISRRGPVSVISSDCGTNFIGAKAQLEAHHELIRSPAYQQAIGNMLAQHRIDWRLNPPAAPHFGGLWEANVKAVKSHLYRVVGTQILAWEEFTTLLTQIEALLNSRPLSILSSDPSEPEALTPAHFLTLTPLRALPLLSDQPDGLSPNSRKALLDQMVKGFWARWRLEYLSSLQPRSKWTDKTKSLAVGTVVVVREENAPPLHWPLGVIEAIHPGADGVVRVATVRLRKTLLKRPVVKLVPLPHQ